MVPRADSTYPEAPLTLPSLTHLHNEDIGNGAKSGFDVAFYKLLVDGAMVQVSAKYVTSQMVQLTVNYLTCGQDRFITSLKGRLTPLEDEAVCRRHFEIALRSGPCAGRGVR